MSFQTLPRNIHLLICSALILFSLVTGLPLSAQQKPNIVLIVCDDAGYADFSIHGNRKINTPRIDSIGTDGVRFSQAYVSASVCSPSRAGFMTGRYQQRFGHELNIPPRFSQENGLPLDEHTMAEALRDLNYRTIALGKWHLGYADKFHPLSRGFDDYFGFLQGARSFWPLDKPTRLNRLLRDRVPINESFGYMTDELGLQAAQYIEQYRQQPFFLYLSFNAVHTPMQATKPDLQGINQELSQKRRKLIAMTHALDRSVGIVLDALEKHDLAEKTLVVFINDNGGATNNASRNGKLRGTKGTPFEGGIRIPYLARWPMVWPKGLVFNQPVSTLDLFPTFLAAAGGDVSGLPNPLDGVNLDPFVRGDIDKRPHDVLFWRRAGNWAIRDGDWKLLSHKAGKPMLFNLVSDRAEKKNVVADNAEIVAKMTKSYEKWNSEMVDAKWRSGRKPTKGKNRRSRTSRRKSRR